MFERYTEKARRVIFFARYEAAQFGSQCIETEHLLQAVLREDRDLMTRFLGPSSIHESIRRQIEVQTKMGERIRTSVDLPLSQATKRVLHYAAEEADGMGQRQIDTVHHLLGLLREENSMAAEILRERGLDIKQVRAGVTRTIPPDTEPQPVPSMPGYVRGPALGGWIGILQDAGRTLLFARQEAAQRQSTCIETTDVLAALSIERGFCERFPGIATSIQARPKPAPIPQREAVSSTELPFTEDCKRAFTLAAQEAAKLGQRAGPEHLVLGILGIESCAAAEVLRQCGLTSDGVRAQLVPPPCDPEQGRSYV